MLISFRDAPLDLLTDVWSKMFPEKYWIDSDLLRINTIDCPVFDWGASSISVFDDQVLGFLTVKRSANPQLYRGPSYDQAHLSAVAFHQPEVGVDMMAYAKKTLRLRGIDKMVFGQDCRHFFPGCPTDCPRLRDFLVVEGFVETGEAVDLENDLAGYQPDPEHAAKLAAAGATVAPLTDDKVPQLKTFLKREFPGRWTHDTMAKVEAEGSCGFVKVLMIDGEVEGFAVTQDATHKVPIAGACWKHDLGNGWGTLGPIGISRGLRGKGLGDALLSSSLGMLKSQGVRRCLIDWTTLVDWYGKHGFVPNRTYLSMQLNL